MYNLELIVIAGSCFFAGAIIGAFFMYRGVHPNSRQKTESQLDSCQKQLRQYQNQMSDFFVQSSFLTEKLNNSYRELQNHLSTSAEQICGLEISIPTLNNASHASLSSKSELVMQPLDYAPKKGNLGTLNEGYGLKDEQPGSPPSSEAYSELT